MGWVRECLDTKVSRRKGLQSHKSLSLLQFTACGHLSALNRVRYEVICKAASMKFHYTMLFNLRGKTFAETNLQLLLIVELGDGRLSPSLQLQRLTRVCRFGPPFPTPAQLLDSICGCCMSSNFCNVWDKNEAIMFSVPGECKYFAIRTHLKRESNQSK